MKRWFRGERTRSERSADAGAGQLGDEWRSPASLEGPGRIDIGPYTYWSPRARFTTWGEGSSIKVGAYCSIASGTQILAGGDHGTDRLSTYPFGLLDTPPAPGREPLRAERVLIGNDVWIGTGAIIVGPASIGDGAVIGAGAVVTSDVPPYAIVGGVPARLIRMRLSEDAVKRLERLAWWDWPLETVRAAEPLLRGEDIGALVAFAIARGLAGSEGPDTTA